MADPVRTVAIPAEILQRANAVGKVYRISIAQMLRDGLLHKIETLEEQRRRELANKLAEKETKRELNRGPGRPRTLGSSTLGPRSLSSITEARRGYSPTGKLDDLYKMLARSIVEVGKNASEVRRRAEAAVETIKREQPLLHPPEDEILATLERYVKQVRESVEELPRSFDSFVNAVIDVSKISTSGSAEE